MYLDDDNKQKIRDESYSIVKSKGGTAEMHEIADGLLEEGFYAELRVIERELKADDRFSQESHSTWTIA